LTKEQSRNIERERIKLRTRNVVVDKSGDKVVAHLAIALFFSLLFVGVGIAAQLMAKTHRDEILAALRGEMPLRKPAPAPRFTVTLRSRPALAPASRRAAA
jgi:hypothetical protein